MPKKWKLMRWKWASRSTYFLVTISLTFLMCKDPRMRKVGATDIVTQGSRLFILVIRYLEHFSGGGAHSPIFPHKKARTVISRLSSPGEGIITIITGSSPQKPRPGGGWACQLCRGKKTHTPLSSLFDTNQRRAGFTLLNHRFKKSAAPYRIRHFFLGNCNQDNIFLFQLCRLVLETYILGERPLYTSALCGLRKTTEERGGRGERKKGRKRGKACAECSFRIPPSVGLHVKKRFEEVSWTWKCVNCRQM